MRVTDLIDPITSTWHIQMLEDNFWPIDCARILAIPIGAITSVDRLVWHFSKDGNYSVRMAYQVAFAARSSESSPGLGAPSGEQRVKWAEICRLELPPKIRLFLWRACKNILPHAAELTRRHVSSNPYCVHCKVAIETTSHVLMECHGLREIWAAAPFRLSPSGSHDSPWMLFCKLKNAVFREDLLLAMVIWWKTWELRNKEVHGVEDGAPPDLLSWARAYLAMYMASQTTTPPAAKEVLPTVWKPPDPYFVKVNVDVAFPANSDCIRVGMVARNARGVTIWWSKREIPSRPQPSEGEALAVVFGLHTVLQQRWDRVILKTDCLPVHRYLISNSSSLVSFGAILDACFVLRSSFTSLLFSFVKRSGNSHAHAIVTASNLVASEGAFFPTSLMI